MNFSMATTWLVGLPRKEKVRIGRPDDASDVTVLATTVGVGVGSHGAQLPDHREVVGGLVVAPAGGAGRGQAGVGGQATGGQVADVLVHVVGTVGDARRDDEVVRVEVVVAVAAASTRTCRSTRPDVARRAGVRGNLADVDEVSGGRAAEVGVAGLRRLAALVVQPCTRDLLVRRRRRVRYGLGRGLRLVLGRVAGGEVGRLSPGVGRWRGRRWRGGGRRGRGRRRLGAAV